MGFDPYRAAAFAYCLEDVIVVDLRLQFAGPKFTPVFVNSGEMKMNKTCTAARQKQGTGLLDPPVNI